MVTLAAFSAIVLNQAKQILLHCVAQMNNSDKKLGLIAYEQVQTLRELIYLFSAENF